MARSVNCKGAWVVKECERERIVTAKECGQSASVCRGLTCVGCQQPTLSKDATVDEEERGRGRVASRAITMQPAALR